MAQDEPPFPQLGPNHDLPALERAVLGRWADEGAFK